MSTNRHRTAGQFLPLTSQWVWRSSLDPTPPWSYGTRPDCLGTFVDMHDVNTPNFRELQRKGLIVNNEMSRLETTYSGSDSGWKFRFQSGSDWWEGECLSNWCLNFVGPPVHLSLPSYQPLIDAASTDALAGIVAPDVQGLVSVAELGKTLSMLRSPMAGLQDLVSRVRRRNPRLSFRQAAEASYLEFRYGWRPLLYEIESITKAVSKEYRNRLTSRAMRSASDSASTSWITGSESAIKIQYSQTTTRDVRVRCGVLYEHTLAFEDVWGVRLSDIPAAAWELVPYSFVVDWFTNVSSYLNAVTPKPGVTSLARWTRVDVTTTSTRTSGTATFSNWTTLRSPNGSDRTVTKSSVRLPLVGPPSLVIKSGSLRGVLSDLRGLDLLALFTQRIR